MKKNEKEQFISNHPYNKDKCIPYTATKLVIGSIPPQRFCKNEGLSNKDVRFYYGSEKNKFWHLIAQATDEKLDYENTQKAIEQRKNLLEKYNLGIIDIIKTCIHKNGLATDKSLDIIEYEKIDELLLEFPNIDTLICTSEFVRKKLNRFANKKYRNCPDSPRKGTLKINDKEYVVITLYSPSPYALLGLGNNGEEKRLNQYKEVFKIK